MSHHRVVKNAAMRTLFFDIDGTLLTTPLVGSDALAESLADEFGLKEADCDLSFAGRTDRDLIREILQRNEIEVTADTQGRLRRRYTLALRTKLASKAGHILPGVLDLLRVLSAKPGIHLAVLTGNFPETARMKLEAFDLIRFFSTIVGGDLDVSRDDMARRAMEQLVRRTGKTARKNVIVIGDTANDVRCARSIGARSLAVCTGSASHDELRAAEADHVVADLCDHSVLKFLIE